MDKKFMKEALRLAKMAQDVDDVPVGAVVVKDGEIIGKGFNMREKEGDPTAHAEIVALRDAAKTLGTWRLDGCEIYVTLEPCPMCAGAIINSRIATVIFGAYDKKAGCCSFDSVTDLFSLPFNHKPEVYGGICEEETAELLTDFFKKRRP